MSLLTDLQSLDLSGIIDARASISVTVNGEELSAIVSSGAAVSALGEFGESLAQLRGSLEDPAELFAPLLDAIAPLLEQLDVDTGALAEYAEAVEAGATIIATLLGNLDADPADLGSVFGRSLGEVMEQAAGLAENYLPVDLDGIGQLKALIERVDGEVSLDPAAFADLILDAIAPFSRTEVAQIRLQLQHIFDVTGGVSFDASLTAPLVAALDAVAAATTEVELEAALTQVEQVRGQVVAAIRGQYQALTSSVGALRADVALEALRSVSGSLHSTEQDILEYLESWRLDIARARELIAGADFSEAVLFVHGFLDQLEATARAQVSMIFEPAVQQLKEWVQGLLAHLRLREIRNAVRSFILGIAQAIRDLNLDVVARELRGALTAIRETIADADLGGAIRAALEAIEQQLTQALSGVTAALQAIGDQVNALAGQAQEVIERLVTVVVEFKGVTDNVAIAIEDLGVDEAAQQVIDTLVSVRETAEELLSAAPLPEPLRGQVEQLIELVQDIDIDSVFDPIHEALAQFDIPESVATTVNEGLAAAQEVVANLIPAELIASIEAEVNSVLDVLRGFDPATLLSDVTAFISETADEIDGVSIGEMANEIAGPFQEVLDRLDELAPDRLLAPVIETYDSLVGQIPAPAPSTVTGRVASAVGASAEAVTRAATEPARSLLPATAGTASEEIPVEEPSLPGDIVRLIGYVPGKLRELLAELEAGPAGEVLAAIDGFTSGLARDLRRVTVEVAAVEHRIDDELDVLLAPVSLAQSRAQLGVRANFAGGGVDLSGAMTVTASAGPGALRQALAETVAEARAEAHAATTAVSGSLGRALSQAADLLEASSLGRVAGSLDSLLEALDPEPIADEIDLLVLTALSRLPEALDAAGDLIASTMLRLASLAEELNPGVQAQRFLEVFNVLQEELDLLNPRHLVADLSEVHAAIRDVIAAYDPRAFAVQLDGILDEVAAQLRGLTPEALLGDLTFLEDTIALVENAVPTQALAGIGASLAEAGEALGGIDISALVEAIEALPSQLAQGLDDIIQAIKNEVIALLESLRFAGGSASVSVSAEVNV